MLYTDLIFLSNVVLFTMSIVFIILDSGVLPLRAFIYLIRLMTDGYVFNRKMKDKSYFPNSTGEIKYEKCIDLIILASCALPYTSELHTASF